MAERIPQRPKIYQDRKGNLYEKKRFRELSLAEWKAVSNEIGIVGIAMMQLYGFGNLGSLIATDKTIPENLESLTSAVYNQAHNAYKAVVGEDANGREVIRITHPSVQDIMENEKIRVRTNWGDRSLELVLPRPAAKEVAERPQKQKPTGK